jgi:hypothetical protein
MATNPTDFEYDVVFSFAGEERALVDPIAERLRAQGLTVFYDTYEQANLWGKDLYVHLHEVYSRLGRHCLMFVSASYAQKAWTNHERRAAQERAFNEKGSDYILPVRIDDTSVPGLPSTIGYIPISLGPDQISALVLQKLAAQGIGPVAVPPSLRPAVAPRQVADSPKRFGIGGGPPIGATVSGVTPAAVQLMNQTPLPDAPRREVLVLPYNDRIAIKKSDAAHLVQQFQVRNRLGSTLFPVSWPHDTYLRDGRGILGDVKPQPGWHVQFALGFDGSFAHREFISETQRNHQRWGSGVGIFSTLDRVMGAALFARRLALGGPSWGRLRLDGIAGLPLVFDYEDERAKAADLFAGKPTATSAAVEITFNFDAGLTDDDIVNLALLAGEELAYFFGWEWKEGWVREELARTLSGLAGT